jgi:hypothetical protein
LSVQHLRHNDVISCQYNTLSTLMRSSVSIIFTRGCVVFRFKHLVLLVKCCLEPFDRQGNQPPIACLFSLILHVTSLFVIPLLLLFILASFPPVLSAFVTFILVFYFFFFPCTLFVYSRFLPFSPFDLLVRPVQCS